MDKRNRAQPTTLLAFGIYLFMLVWIVMWKLHVPFVGRDDMREVKLIPFVSAQGFGASAPLEVGINILLFVPFGIYLGLLARSWTAWRVVAVICCVSLSLECAQYVLAVGSSDATDVIANTTGGLVGMGLLAIARRALVALRFRPGAPRAP